MDPKDQKKITRNMIRITKTIGKDLNGIAKSLVENDVLTFEDYDSICNVKQKVSNLQCGMLINKLLRGGPNAFQTFKKVLVQSGNRKLAETLESTSIDDDLKTTPRSREGTFIIPSPRVPETSLKEAFSNSKRTQQPSVHIDNVRQLEKMMTFVLTKIDETDSFSKRKELCSTYIEETNDRDKVLAGFRTNRYNTISITKQKLVH